LGPVEFYLYRVSTLHTFGHFGVFWSFWSILVILDVFSQTIGSCYLNFGVFSFLSFLTILVKMTVLIKKYQKRSKKVVFRGFPGFWRFETPKITVFGPFLDPLISILDNRGKKRVKYIVQYHDIWYIKSWT
jgi:hypothetical protein